MMPSISLLPLLFSLSLTALVLAAAIIDVTSFRIPNAIPLMLIGLFLVKATAGLEVDPLLPRLPVFAVTLLLGFLAFASGLLGGGDVKLITALSLWFGASTFADFIMITGIVGGLLGIFLLAARRSDEAVDRLQPTGSDVLKERLLDPMAPLPYALPIAIAALWLEWM